MPVQLFGSVRIVVDLDRYLLTVFEAQYRSWELTVVSNGRDDVFRSDLNRTCGNAQGVIRRASFGVLEIWKDSRQTEPRIAR